MVLANVLCVHPICLHAGGLEREESPGGGELVPFPLGLAHALATTSMHVYADSGFQVLHEMIRCAHPGVWWVGCTPGHMACMSHKCCLVALHGAALPCPACLLFCILHPLTAGAASGRGRPP